MPHPRSFYLKLSGACFVVSSALLLDMAAAVLARPQRTARLCASERARDAPPLRQSPSRPLPLCTQVGACMEMFMLKTGGPRGKAARCAAAPSLRALNPVDVWHRPPQPPLAPPQRPGFYDVVTKTEAERWEQTREEREERARQFREAVAETYRRRGQELPPALRRGGE
jgi:hypothetical protein